MKRILLIGGPGSGKTTILSELKKRGFTCFEEISREIIRNAKKKGIDQLFLSNPKEFNNKILLGRINQFKACDSCNNKFIFIDRGIPDIIAYNNYIKTDSSEEAIKASKNYIYDFIFFFPAWKKIFKNDQERYESFEEALQIEKKIFETYKTLNYQIQMVPTGEIYERTNYILNIIEKISNGKNTT